MSLGHLVTCRKCKPTHEVMHRFSKHLAKGVHICIPAWEAMTPEERSNWIYLAKNVKMEIEA